MIVAIDGRPIESFAQMQRIVSTSAGRTLTITVNRGGVREELKAVPTLRGFCNAVLGISKAPAPNDITLQRVAPLAAVGMGLEETYFIVERSVCYLSGVIIGREVGQPIGRARAHCPGFRPSLEGRSRQRRHGRCGGRPAVLGRPAFGLDQVFSTSSRYLCSMGVTFCSMELSGIRGRPLSDRAQEFGFRIGLAIVVMLMIFATYNDIVSIAAQWTAS